MLRVFIFGAALMATGCAQHTAVQTAPIAAAPIACTQDAMLTEGRNARRYPQHCQGDPALFDRYRLGLRIAQLEEELREVNYLRASRDGRGPLGSVASAGRYGYGFGSGAALISRRVEIKNELRYLKRQAGIVE